MPRIFLVLYFILAATAFQPRDVRAACLAAPGQQVHPLFHQNGGAVYCADGDNWAPLPGLSALPGCTVDGATLRWDAGSNAWACAMPVYTTCLQARDAGADTSGLYRIAPAGVIMDAYCDMTTDGGGWTLVKSGHGGGSPQWGAASGYSIAKSDTLAANNYALSDTIINAVKTHAYRVEGTCDNWGQVTTGYASAACVYGSVPDVDNSAACRRWYTNAALGTQLGTTENYGAHISYFGIRDTHTSFVGSYLTTQGTSGSWYIGASGPAGSCNSGSASSRLRIWVR